MSPISKYDEPDVENVAWGLSPSATFSTKGRHIWMSHERPCFIGFVVWPAISLKYDFWLIFNFYQQSGERSCARSTPFGRWRCNIRRVHSNKLKRHLANAIIQHFHVTWKCRTINRLTFSPYVKMSDDWLSWIVRHSIMLKVTWRRFEPISKAARNWSDDNEIWWPSVENVTLGLRRCARFSTSGLSYLNVALTTVNHL